MPVKFWQTIFRFWFFLSYLITTVPPKGGFGSHLTLIFFLFDRSGKRYSTTLNLNGGLEHGLTLELGAYVAKIQPGSVAAKEGSIAIGDRIVCVSKFYST